MKSQKIHTDPDVVVRLEHICKSFGENQVLRDFNLVLRRGQTMVVLGKSGSGKSVLIKCIIGLIHPDSGTIRVFQHNLSDIDTRKLDEMRARVGFLFQSNALYDSMTVRENLEFPLRRHRKGMEEAEVDRLVMEALTNVGLPHTTDMMPSELSGGMRKRIALARTIILKPEIILYDEPTTGLDPITGKEISDLIVELGRKYSTSSIIISHDMHCVKKVAEKVVMLIEGKCYAEGTYEELRKSGDEKVRKFFES
ncbi:MAG: ABC transporter ATP-binding protein [Candidatus Fluviicola riflensis]|nr:MAG: ABC transporter ATP-binding protein [Candidatus Fluviicola riflensis]OGS77836.1 MAG: ABC transporter ATP-binding protein [Candidatus Fluviicola riflensis]OGS84901.1 MAG: ABC transporter ATP-binding protein [Fluviicola sp. RIFCSPHIGHO2_01_FULL_43_53]OGS89173.1 MAG: ABC transporter ATP-binding protein [Fluviicola sp. RIFCSPHIGHO2_12_FULL_43_24]